MFMEAAQGDRRVNVMQAPKLTLFNGQTATLTVTDTAVLRDQRAGVLGERAVRVRPEQHARSPARAPTDDRGLESPSRRWCRPTAASSGSTCRSTMTAQTGATVPLFPVTTFVTPVFEGGSQGLPIPFTQFLQQPAFTTLTIRPRSSARTAARCCWAG